MKTMAQVGDKSTYEGLGVSLHDRSRGQAESSEHTLGLPLHFLHPYARARQVPGSDGECSQSVFAMSERETVARSTVLRLFGMVCDTPWC